jgi:hypothetical protein
MSLAIRYCAVGACYGFARKTLDVCLNAREVTVERRLEQGNDGKYAYACRNRAMLITEKIAVVAMHTCLSTMYSPYFIVGDLNRAEAYLRDIDLDPPRGIHDDEQTLIYHAVK